MNFRNWLEIIEPVIPKGYRRKNTIKNASTNNAKPMIKINFTTKLKNKVEVQLIDNWNKEYQVIFYVNNVLDDNASSGERYRDPEILPGVLGLLKRESDKIHANKFTFTAHSGQGDEKLIRGMDAVTLIKNTNEILNQFKNAIKSHVTTMLPPNQQRIDLFNKLNRPIPGPEPDFNKEKWLEFIRDINIYMTAQPQSNQGRELEVFIYNLRNEIERGSFKYLDFDIERLYEYLKDTSIAIQSLSQEGYLRKENRRAAIYKRLVEKYFSSGWDITISGDRFTLTRK
jgi:hypothetical protein